MAHVGRDERGQVAYVSMPPAVMQWADRRSALQTRCQLCTATRVYIQRGLNKALLAARAPRTRTRCRPRNRPLHAPRHPPVYTWALLTPGRCLRVGAATWSYRAPWPTMTACLRPPGPARGSRAPWQTGRADGARLRTPTAHGERTGGHKRAPAWAGGCSRLRRTRQALPVPDTGPY